MILGADVGGTFTDLVAVDDGRVTTNKVPTTPDQSHGVVEGSTALRGDRTVSALVHGTTVATNALLERKGAHTLLVTDEGFEDVIEIGRQDRPSLYDPLDDRSAPLVSRQDRIPASGLDRLASVEAVAVALVDGHMDHAAERALADEVSTRLPDVPISVSSVVAPEFREFERVATTVLNAYLTPVTATYLDRLGALARERSLTSSLSGMRSSGGVMSLADAAALPAAALLSGPAGGVVATQALAERLGRDHVISFDMGGTSTDVCRIADGTVDVSYERTVDGHVCRLPSVGVHTVGAGGGSIAWVDPGGSLRVGPKSAGADPGPACYGRGGTEATVTDANVVLGRIDPAALLGGEVALDADAAHEAVGRIADRLGLGVAETAIGVITIAEEVMAGAVRTVTVEQGADPATASLVAFGGAGGLHATAVARRLGLRSVIVPRHAGVFSAVGLLLAPPRTDLARAVYTRGDLAPVIDASEDLEREATSALSVSGHDATSVRWTLDARYVGQAHEIGVAWEPGVAWASVVDRFERLHRGRNGFVRSGDPVEIVTVRCTATAEPPLRRLDVVAAEASEAPSTRLVRTSQGVQEMATIQPREGLVMGAVLSGPAVIEEAEATTYIDTGERAEVLADGSIEVTW